MTDVVAGSGVRSGHDSVAERSAHARESVGHASGCRHCAAPLPRGNPFDDFCCPGCRAVHGLLVEGGLQRFYELGGGRPLGSVPGTSDEDAWIEALEAEHTVSEVVAVKAAIQGMHCAACVWLLQKLWEDVSGSLRMRLNPGTGEVKLQYRRGSNALRDFARRIASLGYRLRPAVIDDQEQSERSADRGLVLRFGVCAALAMNAMTFAFADHFGMEDGDDLAPLFRVLSGVLATLAVVIGGPVFFRPALAGVRHGLLHLDLPISLGILLAHGGSIAVVLSAWDTGGSDGAYFDSVTVFVMLMLGGRLVQRRAVRRHRSALLAGGGAPELKVRRLDRDETGGETVVHGSAGALKVGDRVLLAPGELVPVDAKLESERGNEFSLDWIQGESRPVRFEPGSLVPAGAFHRGNGPVVVEAAEGGHESDVLALVAGGNQDRDTSVRGNFWDRLGRVYAALVLVLAAATATGWILVDASRALQATVAVLVVTCPCAIGLAIPLAFEAASAQLRRRGVLVVSQGLLDRALQIRKVIFDKTGTLTWGGLHAEAMRDVPGASRDVLFTMASSSGHPVARAVVESIARDGRPEPHYLDTLEVEEVIGRGVIGHWMGTEFRLGSESFALGDPGPTGGESCVFSRGGHTEAVFAIDEDVRPGVDQEIASLGSQGLDVHLLSGDRVERVQRFGARLGLSEAKVHGGVGAIDKGRFVEAIDDQDTMVVGDGLNDAHAFEVATLCGTPALDRPVLPGRSDFIYSGVGSGAVGAVLETARRHRSAVVRTLWAAAIYNVVAVSAASLGFVTPLVGAVAMPVGSIAILAVTALSMREGSND